MILVMFNYFLLIGLGVIPAVFSLIDMVFPWPYMITLSIKLQEQIHLRLLDNLDDQYSQKSLGVELSTFVQGIIFVIWFFIAQFNIK